MDRSDSVNYKNNTYGRRSFNLVCSVSIEFGSHSPYKTHRFHLLADDVKRWVKSRENVDRTD
jgi:hypothetical protein